MGLPETDLARIRRWVDACNARVAERARDQIRHELDIDERAVTILGCRRPWRGDFGTEWTRFPIARLRYARARRAWQIYWRDRNLKFHAYDLVPPMANVQGPLAEIGADPTCIYWGRATPPRAQTNMRRGPGRWNTGSIAGPVFQQTAE